MKSERANIYFNPDKNLYDAIFLEVYRTQGKGMSLGEFIKQTLHKESLGAYEGDINALLIREFEKNRKKRGRNNVSQEPQVKSQSKRLDENEDKIEELQACDEIEMIEPTITPKKSLNEVREKVVMGLTKQQLESKLSIGMDIDV